MELEILGLKLNSLKFNISISFVAVVAIFTILKNFIKRFDKNLKIKRFKNYIKDNKIFFDKTYYDQKEYFIKKEDAMSKNLVNFYCPDEIKVSNILNIKEVLLSEIIEDLNKKGYLDIEEVNEIAYISIIS